MQTISDFLLLISYFLFHFFINRCLQLFHGVLHGASVELGTGSIVVSAAVEFF